MFSHDDKIRVPVSGVRQRLRMALRRLGFQGKFGTVHLRRDPGGKDRPCLIVVAKSGQTELPLIVFDEMPVYLYRR
jgi:hypothetical protein